MGSTIGTYNDPLGRDLQERKYQSDVSLANAQAQSQLIGAGISAVGSIGGGVLGALNKPKSPLTDNPELAYVMADRGYIQNI
jgi:hypothetical protein